MNLLVRWSYLTIQYLLARVLAKKKGRVFQSRPSIQRPRGFPSSCKSSPAFRETEGSAMGRGWNKAAAASNRSVFLKLDGSFNFFLFFVRNRFEIQFLPKKIRKAILDFFLNFYFDEIFSCSSTNVRTWQIWRFLSMIKVLMWFFPPLSLSHTHTPTHSHTHTHAHSDMRTHLKRQEIVAAVSEMF